MPFLSNVPFLPTKLRYQLIVAFCLMSLLPVLLGVYGIFVIVQSPLQSHLSEWGVILTFALLSLSMSFMGYLVTRQLLKPAVDVNVMAHKIAMGKLDEREHVKGAEDWEELSKSLRTISTNALELLEKVERLSMRDKLTGLYNATYIRERLDEEIQRAIHHQYPCSCAYLTIDRLDVYTTRYGRDAAEEVLRGFAKVINANLREFDRAARIARDEFVLILPDTNKKKAMEMITAIEKNILESVGKNREIGISAGLSENPIDGSSADELYLKAQVRTRFAQKTGKLFEAFV